MSATYKTQEEIEEKLHSEKPMIILRYLLDGGTWKHEGRSYILSDDYELCTVAHRCDKDGNILHGEENEVYLRVDFTLGAFIKECFATSTDETTIYAANMTLARINKRRT